MLCAVLVLFVKLQRALRCASRVPWRCGGRGGLFGPLQVVPEPLFSCPSPFCICSAAALFPFFHLPFPFLSLSLFFLLPTFLVTHPFPVSILVAFLFAPQFLWALKQAPQETKGSGFPNSVRQPWELQNDRGTWRAGFLCTGEVCRARNSCGRASFRLSMPWELTHALVTSSGRGGSSSSSCSSGGGSSSFSNGSRSGAPIALLVVAFGN